MSHFERSHDGGDESSGHDVEQATMEVPRAYWEEQAEESTSGSWYEDADPGADEADMGAEAADPDGDAGERPGVGARMTHFRERVRDALAGLDLGAVARPTFVPEDPEATQAFDVLADVPAEDEPEAPDPAARFAVVPLGYSRTAVEEHIAALERELSELRTQSRPEPAPMSISEEIERLGEQTASILIVAHDQAHETTRLAHEQAERRLAEANMNAEAITEQARRRLESLDLETDLVWQERAKLLEDARGVAGELIELIERAEARFPEELKSADVERQA